MPCKECEKNNKFANAFNQLIRYYASIIMAMFFSILPLLPVYYYFVNDLMILNYIGAFTMGCGWTLIFLILFSLFAKEYKVKL